MNKKLTIILLIITINIINNVKFTQSYYREESIGKRCTWIPVSQYDTTESNTNKTMFALSQFGVNRVYIDVWNQGLTYFNSTTMFNFIGNEGIGPNQLSWGVKYAKLYGLEVFAWFEYGNIAAYSSVNNPFAEKAQSLGWISGISSNFVWLDPSNTDVINFISGIMIDAFQSEPNLDGVQLDDHFGWPSDLPNSNIQSMTTAANSIWKNIRSTNEIISLSLSPLPLSYAIENYNVDWKEWSNIGLFSEYVPQLYTTSFDSFVDDINSTLESISVDVHPYMLAGVRCNGSGAPTDWNQLVQMINYTVSLDLGVSVWYAEGILQTYPSNFYQLWGNSP